jgi:hypothetical protein
MKMRTFAFAVLGGLVLLAGAALIPSQAVSVPAVLSQPVQAADVGFSVLPDGLVGPT